MKKSRFTEEQMVTILREADKAPVSEVAKKHGVSEQTIYNWRQHFGGLEAADVKRLKQLEQENARLKKMLAERDLELDVMKETGLGGCGVLPGCRCRASDPVDARRCIALGRSRRRRHDTSGRTTSYSTRAPTASS